MCNNVHELASSPYTIAPANNDMFDAYEIASKTQTMASSAGKALSNKVILMKANNPTVNFHDII